MDFSAEVLYSRVQYLLFYTVACMNATSRARRVAWLSVSQYLVPICAAFAAICLDSIVEIDREGWIY